MFWKFNLESSGIDTLLAKQDVTLLEVLDEEDVLQECKTPNDKLLDFLTKAEILKELLHLVIDTPSDDVEETLKYKYMNIACEIIILDIDAILDKIANDTEFMDIIWSFMDNIPPLNPLIASFFSKVITMLICRKGQQTFEYLKSHDAVNKLIVNIEISAIMELFIKMVTAVENVELKMEICKWMNEENLIEKLIDYLHPSEDEQKHYCAGQLLGELVRIGRDNNQFIDHNDTHNDMESPLLTTLEKRETIEKLLTVMFSDIDHPNSDSSIVNGISALSSMIEIKRPTIEGMEELMTPMDVERIVLGCHNALEVLATRLSDFHDALVRPHPTSSMETTYGILDPPLGKVRLSIAGLIASAIATSSFIINESLSKTGTINVLLDLFSRYEWNNFLHTHVQHCIFGILNSEVESPTIDTNETNEEVENNTCVLLKHLFQECNMVQRCLTLWEANDISEKSGNHRKGYMGHLTKIINEIRNSREKGPNVESIQSMFNEFSDETRQQWTDLLEGSLEETNKRNLCAPMNSWFNPMDSDSEGDDYRPISISQYDGTMQQAFENYQVQPMSNEFIETFGYDENSLQENENIKNPFDEVGKIDFTINANEESENEKLYNNICEQKIRPFDDSSDSDEEDMWEEKELTFTHPSQPRESNDTIRSDSESSSDEEKELKVDSPGNAINAFPDPFDTQSNQNTEKMDVDSEWTANFDCFAVSTQDAPTEWPIPENTNVLSLSTSGEDFANFIDLCKFNESNDGQLNSHDMETEHVMKPSSSSSYEVRMEEDPSSPHSASQIELVEKTSTEQCDDGGVAVIAITTKQSSTSSTHTDSLPVTSPSPSPSNVQSTSIQVHIDSPQNHSEKRQTVITSLDTRLSDGETPTDKPDGENNERTCKNEIKIDVNQSPIDGDENKNAESAGSSNTVGTNSVLLNGPPSSEISVNSSGKLAT